MILNLRDLSYLKTEDGYSIRPGMLIRSSRLSDISEDDEAWLRSIPVTKVVDFRSRYEVQEDPDKDIGAQRIYLAISEGGEGIAVERDTAAQDALIPLIKESIKNPEVSMEFMLEEYMRMISGDKQRSLYRRFVDEAMSNDSGATLWHCTAGKDRAGIASIIIEASLGVSLEDIKADYLETNKHIQPMSDMMLEYYSSVAPVEQIRKAIEDFFLIRPEYFTAVIEEIEDRWGGIDGWLRNGFGIGDKMRSEMREKFLVL